jgi:hypothetical protein
MFVEFRYRVIQHGQPTGSTTKILWSETYNMEINHSNSQYISADSKREHLDLVLTFIKGAPNLADVKTKIKVDIKHDYVIGGERCLFHRRTNEWMVNYNNVNAMSCLVQ